MVTSVRRLLLVLAYLAGLASGMYLTAAAVQGHAQSAEVAAAIHEASVAYGVSEGWMRSIARCESRFVPWVTSRGGHVGLYQFAWGTWDWMSRQAGLAGADPFDPWAAAMVTGWGLAHGYSGHWACA